MAREIDDCMAISIFLAEIFESVAILIFYRKVIADGTAIVIYVAKNVALATSILYEAILTF